MPQAEAPYLIVREGELAGQRWSINADAVTIGREADCDIVLPERQVSRHHLRIYGDDTGYYAEDLQSKNGTHLNGQPLIGKQRLQDGDELQIALAVKLAFIGSEATLPLGQPPSQRAARRLTLDTQARAVYIAGREIEPLSAPQFRLLELLYEHEGRIVTREDLVAAVWPEAQSTGVSEQAIDALVRRLRERLAEGDAEHNYILTVRGHGFRLDNPRV
jgi:hypothetical protein